MPNLGETVAATDQIEQFPGCRSLKRVLIANNGLAAMKCLISIRQWLQKQFDTSSCVTFVCIATPDEMKAASQYLKLADEIIMAPGGKNTQNFANVEVIVSLALQSKADAVYVGWGHASENPELSRKLEQLGIVFIGPSTSAIVASGDKIVSTIIAQSIGMPTVNWSGREIRVEKDQIDFHALREKTTIRTVAEGLEAISRYGIDVPLMIKASEGGGGKGIRKCEKLADFSRMFKEVQMEVPESPIFLMKCMENARHVEIQILGDQWGEVMALSSRDCTIQRRCQKVIEEAPASIVPKKTLRKMEKDAINFAKFVDYYSAGTVEMLFIPSTNKYYFLELNPRLQVEHPCTEAVCDVNVPALQFQIAMGRKLADIEDIQRYKAMKARGDGGKVHSMAARVTCEDPMDRFLPSTGYVKSLKFGSTSKAWAYFSLTDGSTVHEFADSQIGHVFARGRDRPEAIANLKHALQNLKIDATFPTQSDYLIDLLSLEKFKNNSYDTQWLDKRIANRDGQKATISLDHIVAISAAAIGNLKIRRIFEKYEKSLKSGKIVLPVELSRTTDVELQVKNLKFSVKVYEETSSKYQIRLGAQETTVEILKIGKEENGQKIAVHQGKSVEFQLEESEDFYVIKIAGNKLKFAKTDQDDASVLRSPYTGKFLEYKTSPGEFVEVGETYAQIESMKMVFDVVVKVAPGRLIPMAKEGDLISPGSILSRLEIDEKVKEQLTTSEKFEGKMEGWKVEEKSPFQKAKLILEGRGCMDCSIDELISSLFETESHAHILELIEQFVDSEAHFNPCDGFDENVQKLQKIVENSEEIVNRIHSNTHLKTKCSLILGILEKEEIQEKFQSSPKFFEVLKRVFEEIKVKSVALQAARILQKITGNSGKIEQKTASFGASSVKFSIFSENCTFLENLEMALISIYCYQGAREKERFVANRVEIFGGNFEKMEVKLAIEEKKERLEEMEVKEIIITTSKDEKWRFVNEIGEFFEENPIEIQEFAAPEKRDLKRFLARQNRTTYIYDFPQIFARIALEKSGNSEISWKNCIEIQEITLENNNQLDVISDEEMLEKRAREGANSSSVVAWILKLKIGAHQDALLEFVLIGNDITHQVGSFAQPEHRLFEAASKLARQRKIPRMNISCNSGARIGLARDVLEVLKVKLKPNGHDFDYLYVEASEKERIGEQIVYERIGDELRLVAVKGRKNEYIGLENLMGSGAIGGETSRAYREIPTYCYVTGRSVGIGAYTARLARRIIQHERAHLILTGAMALNTLLGKKVYASNNRLGGTEIMSNNGIAHTTVSSDLAGIRKLVEWMDYLPKRRNEFPFFTCFFSSDLEGNSNSIENEREELEEVEVTREEMHRDVRNVIRGIGGKQGIFDTGSFDEICSSWAASIVTGRATLNGLPVGIIASQWKSFEKRQLADESVESSQQTDTQKAGQVWYPDSAFKTSQAISDFNRESLPLVLIASLRGFSGGRKDMCDQVLTFGAHIIDELSQYRQPVIVYIPAGGELRGGAWAVVDSNVNRGIIHLIADESARGGILEPNAVVGIKIREQQMGKLMERSDLLQNASSDSLKSAFKKAAVEFADMHDRWPRMESVGAIREVTNLRKTRDVFWKVLRKEMMRCELAKRFRTAPIFPQPTFHEALEWIDVKIWEHEGKLEEYYKAHFWNDVKEEVLTSKRRFEENVATWKSEYSE